MSSLTNCIDDLAADHTERMALTSEHDFSNGIAPVHEPQTPVRAARRWVFASLTLVILASVVALWTVRNPVTNVSFQPQALQQKLEIAPALSGMIRTFWGNQDPFHFQCPLPLALAVTNMGSTHHIKGNGYEITQSKNATKVQLGGFKITVARGAGDNASRKLGAPETAGCCKDYSKTWWPYQYPECKHDGNCPSCWKASPPSQLQTHLATASVAGVAWAAAIAVYENEPNSGVLQKGSGHMSAQLLNGLHLHVTNVCPNIKDWRMYTFDFGAEQLRVRAYKSHTAKLAVISFRGTEPADLQNFVVDFDIAAEDLHLGKQGETGQTAKVHRGYIDALRNLMPHVKKWVDGFILGWGRVPLDWRLVLTGHSMGGAFAILAATLMFLQAWDRVPDAVVTFGAPRVADRQLSDWWEQKDLCKKILRISVYNDIIPWLPFANKSQTYSSIGLCMTNPKACFNTRPSGDSAQFDDWWRHVCPSSEYLVPGATKGVNGDTSDFTMFGGGLAHQAIECRFGYAFGVMSSDITKLDQHCGITRAICPKMTCHSVEDLTGKQCDGLWRKPFVTSASTCRDACCNDQHGTCEVWQWLKGGNCWLGRSDHCTKDALWAKDVLQSERIK